MSKLNEGLTYQYLSANSPPTREERVGVCSAFVGSGSSLKSGMGNGCAKFCSRKFSQGSGCQLLLALGIVASLTNVVVIIHSPLGCASSNVGSAGIRKGLRASKGKVADEYIWLHTNLDEIDVISGGTEKLKRTILYAEQEYRPEAIIVANGCVPGIIGDDIDSVIEDLGKRISTKIVPVHCEGFRSKFVASGYDSAYHGVLKKLVDPPQRYEEAIPDEARAIREKYKYSKTVNILNVGSNSYGDEVELSRLVAGLGLTPRVLPLHNDVAELSRISEAALNVSICSTHDDYLVGHLKERFGTDYILGTLPIGIKNTYRWIREIAEVFQLEKEAERLIELETERLEEALEPFRKVLQGKTVYVGGGETRIFTTGEFFQHLGMKVVGYKPHNFDRFALHFLDDVESDVVVEVAPGQPAEEINLLNKLRPDLYVGHMGANGWVTKLGISNMPLFGQSFNYMGYSGAYELARKAAKVIQNTSFVKKISGNVALPFRDTWYAENPFDNIKNQEAF